MAQYPLANGPEGNPIDVPTEAVAWRVRRGGGRGRPRTLIDGETGRPLELPLSSTIDDMADRGCPPGRYRLEAVDAAGQAIPGVVGITEVSEALADEEEGRPLGETGNASLLERQMQLIEQQNLVLFRALDAMSGAFGTVQPAFPPPAPAASVPMPGFGGLAGFLANLKPEAVQAMVKVFGELSKIGKGDEGGGGGFGGFGVEGGEA